MKTLFAKIFIWFFVSVVVLISASYGLTRLTMREPRRVPREWGDPFVIHAEYAREALERDGRAGLDHFLDLVETTSRMSAYVVDRNGRDIRGVAVPSDVDSLAREVFAGRTTGFREKDKQSYFGYRLGAAAAMDSSVLVLVPPGGPKPPRHGSIPFIPPHGRWIVIVLIGIGGVLCYFLARHVTSPVTRLRRAVADLAAGDFSARVEAGRGMGDDELAALGRDFNVMADRIESLVASHNQLLRDVSHELRSPLARIRVAIALVQQQGSAGDRQALPGNGESIDPALLARIEREVERLDSLIGQVLTLSRLEAGVKSAKSERIDIGGLVHSVAEDARFEAAGKGSEVRFEKVEGLFLEGEPSILRSAIENVIRNAVRVSAPGAPVEIELEEIAEVENPDNAGNEVKAANARKYVAIRVLDRGPGVSDGDLERIFEPFTRGEKSRDRQSGGTGLGLAIARRAIETHGGSIRAHAREGGGLVVWMCLPLAGEGGKKPDNAYAVPKGGRRS
jgi:two-component system, OmpR family, sensor histidine kinase CpxA